MRKIIIIGCPGSGKSTYCEKYKNNKDEAFNSKPEEKRASTYTSTNVRSSTPLFL